MTDTREPLREDFQAVAEWLGIKITTWTVTLDGIIPCASDSYAWRPDIPGADGYALMAAIMPDVYWTAYFASVSVKTFDAQSFEVTEGHNGTPESKSAALASAVWQCAVRVAMEAKR